MLVGAAESLVRLIDYEVVSWIKVKPDPEDETSLLVSVDVTE